VVDTDQSLAGSYKHAMRSIFQLGASGIEGAQLESQQYIAENLAKAVDEQMKYENGLRKDAPNSADELLKDAPYASAALVYFGYALHTVTDSASPWHSGTQIWGGAGSLGHIVNENNVNTVRSRYDMEIQQAEYLANILWQRFQTQVQKARQAQSRTPGDLETANDGK